MSEHLSPIDPQNPGFDPGEPSARGLLVFIVVAVVILVAVFVGTTAYYEFAREKQEDESVQAKPSEELAALRAREDSQLKTYGYIDKSKGVVQIPLDRAMELIAKEAAEGKVKYNTAPTPVKKEPDTAAAPAAPAAH